MLKYLLLFALAFQAAALEMPALFGDHMVLQRNAPIRVWGRGEPGETIRVRIDNTTVETTAALDGNWFAELPPREAGGPFTLEAAAKSGTLCFNDVMTGELWLCSGQSNMAWRVRECDNGAEVLKSAAVPNLRLLQVAREWTREAQWKGSGQWALSSPDSARDFSAVGWFFGRKLAAELGVTVGLIDVSWGGTMIEPWLAPGSTASSPALQKLTNRMEKFDPAAKSHQAALDREIAAFQAYAAELAKCRAERRVPPAPPTFDATLRPEKRDDPAVLYHGMISPLVPAAVGGVLWYQGEANRYDGMLYSEKLKALAAGWKHAFRMPELPFYIVQLAPFEYANSNFISVATLLAAQSAAAREIDGAALAVINDVANLRDIHPRNKLPVGERLANLALKRRFGKAVKAEFPEGESCRVIPGGLAVTFRNAEQLSTRDGKAPSWFEICGADGIFHSAEAEISGTNEVTVRSGAVAEPVAVRFAWSIAATPNLVNEAGLPAGLFRLGELPLLNPIQDEVPESAGYRTVCEFDPLNARFEGKKMIFQSDRSAEFAGKKLKRIAYYLELTQPDGSRSWVWCDLKPFTDDVKKIGVPQDWIFQKDVTDVLVATSADLRSKVANGRFPTGCNIEFWPNNYRSENDRKLTGASEGRCDFSDRVAPTAAAGYGSMQLHHYGKRQTIFAYNHWRAGKECDLGIGNNTGTGHPDWTGAKTGQRLTAARLLILVQTEK